MKRNDPGFQEAERRARIANLASNMHHGVTPQGARGLVSWWQGYHAKMTPPDGEWVVPEMPDWLMLLVVTAGLAPARREAVNG